MENRKIYAPAYRLLAAGLLIGAAGQILSRFTNMPDILTGLLLGIGLGIEIIAFVRIKKLRKQFK